MNQNQTMGNWPASAVSNNVGTGVFNTGFNPQDYAKKSFAGMIMRLFPNGTAPLFALTSMLKESTALQLEHGYWSKSMVFPKVTMSAAALATDTTLAVTDSSQMLVGMVLRSGAQENILVTGITDSTHITVQRAMGQIAGQAISSGDVLYQVGSAFEQASFRPVAMNIMPQRITNYTQIFRNTWAVSGSEAATQVIVGDTPTAESRRDCASFHASDIERAIFFGQKYLGARNGQTFSMMDGLESVLRQYASSNLNTAGATTTFDQLEAMLDPVFNVQTDPSTANERVLFVGGGARKVINAIGRKTGTYYIVDGQTSFGLQFSTFKISRGTFRMIEHPMFNTNPVWSKMAVAVDLSTFGCAYLGNRKTQSLEFNTDGNATDNGIDAIGGTLTSELTTEIKNPAANAMIYGLTAAA